MAGSVMTRPCYRCESGSPALDGMGLCQMCADETFIQANKEPQELACANCSHVFVTDWERVKHELIGSHHYRAWTGPAPFSKKGRAA
jgi:hypothetical protein